MRIWMAPGEPARVGLPGSVSPQATETTAGDQVPRPSLPCGCQLVPSERPRVLRQWHGLGRARIPMGALWLSLGGREAWNTRVLRPPRCVSTRAACPGPSGARAGPPDPRRQGSAKACVGGGGLALGHPLPHSGSPGEVREIELLGFPTRSFYLRRPGR